MIKYLFLGIVQGVTEFLPVSSSGHLVILERLFGLQGQEVAITVFLHLATVLALVVFFFKDILKVLRDLRLMLLIITVVLITGSIGIAGKGFFEKLFSSPKAVAISFFATGVILLYAGRLRFPQRTMEKIKFSDAVILGITQAIAIIPGVSRSGITISTLLSRKLDYASAFRFSFLAAIPVMIGAALVELKGLEAMAPDKGDLTAGFLASFLAGLIALFILRRIMRAGKFYLFGYYCIAIAVITLIFVK
ncbi:MAG: undecaprenyl-diphosphate phosphatase [Candidatus Omnitrophica bacterium]|nr:undecaprenyl-diphosphate phosphatase [Candidatus Omnitrophota bacterium]MDD5611206.1 undecaprenyl-diphosphate phosphatase [Candidatus Omnitrophota bacterium]